MNYAPIIIPTLNRVDHLTKLLDSLRRNSLAQYTDVFIGLDYPPSSLYEEGYERMCEYLQSDFSCFNSFNIIKRSENFGYLRNVEDLIDQILQLHDRFIYMDDDLELSPNFLEYMNKCLTEYECRDEIIAVCGYSYPLKWSVEQNSTIFEQSFICPMWGTGFWKDKYQKISNYISKDGRLARDARSIVMSGGYRHMIDVCRGEFVDLCFSPDFYSTLASRVTDISLRMYMAACNKCVIMPVDSKVRNWGFDGTGEFCAVVNDKSANQAKSYFYNRQPIDKCEAFNLIRDTFRNDDENKKLLNKFDSISLMNKIKRNVKLYLYVLCGSSIYKRLTMRVRLMKKII